MGGNARFIDRSTGEILGYADKIDLTKIARSDLTNIIKDALQKINELFNASLGYPLWVNFDAVKSGKVFSGSSRSLFDNTISDKEFLKYKPILGDIDLTFPNEYMSDLWKFLNDIEGEQIIKGIKYLGHKYSAMDPDKAGNMQQINAIFELKFENFKAHIQIDFEASEYKNGDPTEWSSFSHSSSWDDISSNFKGVMHKLTIINLARASSKMEGSLFVVPSSASKITSVTSKEYSEFLKTGDSKRLAKLSSSKEFINPTNLAFSVDKGLRIKFNALVHSDGVPCFIDGKPVFVKKDSKTDNYETDLLKIFELIFNKVPDANEFKLFHSFKGVVSLMKKYTSSATIDDFFINQLVKKSLFCDSCQGLERNDPEGDFNIKNTMITYFYEQFEYLLKYKESVETMYNSYYAQYKMVECLEDKKLMLSEIFESLETNLLPPKGYKHFDYSRQITELTKYLLKLKDVQGNYLFTGDELKNLINKRQQISTKIYKNIKFNRPIMDYINYLYNFVLINE